ncbi:Protein of unknown function [Cotesia congregata]|uniref:Uncharacterized protein n=1 Tax=Cotesia congregata TaxID=51543 RepID=A0A8J2EBD0_COTCN|nr:Protein of unknown function [Cotesia congregata]
MSLPKAFLQSSKYDNYAEFFRSLKYHELLSGHEYNVNNSTSLATCKVNGIHPKFEYYYIRYICKFGPKSWKNRTEDLKKDPELCPAMFTVHCREKKYLQMDNLNVLHNHQSVYGRDYNDKSDNSNKRPKRQSHASNRPKKLNKSAQKNKKKNQNKVDDHEGDHETSGTSTPAESALKNRRQHHKQSKKSAEQINLDHESSSSSIEDLSSLIERRRRQRKIRKIAKYGRDDMSDNSKKRQKQQSRVFKRLKKFIKNAPRNESEEPKDVDDYDRDLHTCGTSFSQESARDNRQHREEPLPKLHSDQTVNQDATNSQNTSLPIASNEKTFNKEPALEENLNATDAGNQDADVGQGPSPSAVENTEPSHETPSGVNTSLDGNQSEDATNSQNISLPIASNEKTFNKEPALEGNLNATDAGNQYADAGQGTSPSTVADERTLNKEQSPGVHSSQKASENNFANDYQKNTLPAAIDKITSIEVPAPVNSNSNTATNQDTLQPKSSKAGKRKRGMKLHQSKKHKTSTAEWYCKMCNISKRANMLPCFKCCKFCYEICFKKTDTGRQMCQDCL